MGGKRWRNRRRKSEKKSRGGLIAPRYVSRSSQCPLWVFDEEEEEERDENKEGKSERGV